MKPANPDDITRAKKLVTTIEDFWLHRGYAVTVQLSEYINKLGRRSYFVTSDMVNGLPRDWWGER